MFKLELTSLITWDKKKTRWLSIYCLLTHIKKSHLACLFDLWPSGWLQTQKPRPLLGPGFLTNLIVQGSLWPVHEGAFGGPLNICFHKSFCLNVKGVSSWLDEDNWELESPALAWSSNLQGDDLSCSLLLECPEKYCRMLLDSGCWSLFFARLLVVSMNGHDLFPGVGLNWGGIGCSSSSVSLFLMVELIKSTSFVCFPKNKYFVQREEQLREGRTVQESSATTGQWSDPMTSGRMWQSRNILSSNASFLSAMM